MGSATIVLFRLVLSSVSEMPKRQHRGSGSGIGSGSSSSGSSNSSRKRRQARTTMPPTPSRTPASASSSTAESDPLEADSTNTASTTPAPGSPSSTASPKLSKFDKVKAALRRKLPSGKNKKKTSISSNSSGGISDTSVEGDSPINTKKGRIAVVPEVTVTPSTDSSTSASPAASVRTIFRIDPRTGKPAQQQPRRTRNSSRASSPQFPRRTSSLRHSDEFPFDPNTAARQPDDSHLYQSNPPSPTACRQLSARPLSLEAPSITSNNSPDKPLPALPVEQRSSVIDFHAAGTATPAQVSPKSIKTDDDDTPRAPAWPLPVERQSVYGPASPVFDAPAVPPKDNSPTTVDDDDATPPARSGSGSSQLSLYGFHYYNPLDDRVLAARLQQIRANLPNNVTPDDIPSVPTSTAAPGTPPTFTNQFEDAFQTFSSQTPAQSKLSTRASFASALSTTASFMTAMEDVGGDADDEASAAEGEAAAENKGLSTALLSPTENNDASPAETNVNDAPEAVENSGIAMSESAVEDDVKSAIFKHPDTDGASEPAPAIAADIAEIEEEKADEDEENAEPTVVVYDDIMVPMEDDLSNLPFRVTSTGPPELSTELHGQVLEWVYNGRDFACFPDWKTEPDINAIKDAIRPYARLCGLPNDDIQIEFLAEGRWNRVYNVSATDKETNTMKECIFRCSLPDLPWYRTQLQVSSMEFVRHNTTIPIPQVYAFNSSMKTPLGLEWILMEKIHGKSYCDAEYAFSFETKAKFHRTVAEWVDQLSRLQFDKIGALYRNWSKPVSEKDSYQLGPLNDEDFKTDLRLDHNVYRGPFATMEQYTHSKIGFRLAEALDPRMEERVTYWEARSKFKAAQEANEEGISEKPSNDFEVNPEIEQCSDPNYNRAVLKEVPHFCMRLQSVLPIIFDGENVTTGSSSLSHLDIHDENILVDETGKPLALLDWEQTLTLPIEWTPRYPKIIDTEEYFEPEPWTIIGPRDMCQAQDEAEWERHLLKCEFDKRLEELDSPFLKERKDRDDLETIENNLLMIRFACLDDDFTPEVKARALKALKG